MDHGFTWGMAWPTAVPIAAGFATLVLPRWLANFWTAAAAAKSARVVAALGGSEERASDGSRDARPRAPLA